ncbi:hypothetical protein [Telluria antibiotica]|uniref:hypothetical protein n=1 Tax=Telluria antibiotica TaxID=2717319 RepID=UPI001E5A6970|nr:hypothetical protein [Telluria antibiotica]
MFLDSDEIRELTCRVQHAAQVRVLRGWASSTGCGLTAPSPSCVRTPRKCSAPSPPAAAARRRKNRTGERSMPRARKPENKGLPLRWRHTHGAYYYQVPPGQEAAWDGKKLFRLGATLSDAYTVWAERLKYVQDAKTVAQLLDRYALEVIPRRP